MSDDDENGNEGSSPPSSRQKSFGCSGRVTGVLCQVAKELDLSETSLRGWAGQVDIDAGKGAPEALRTAERDELTKLRKQVKRLEMEREILEKAAAFFAKESE